jgi:hypothetical protein
LLPPLVIIASSLQRFRFVINTFLFVLKAVNASILGNYFDFPGASLSQLGLWYQARPFI